MYIYLHNVYWKRPRSSAVVFFAPDPPPFVQTMHSHHGLKPTHSVRVAHVNTAKTQNQKFETSIPRTKAVNETRDR
jgi:hypothetical protein